MSTRPNTSPNVSRRSKRNFATKAWWSSRTQSPSWHMFVILTSISVSFVLNLCLFLHFQLQMLGYDISWSGFNIIEVMSSTKFGHKVRSSMFVLVVCLLDVTTIFFCFVCRESAIWPPRNASTRTWRWWCWRPTWSERISTRKTCTTRAVQWTDWRASWRPTSVATWPTMWWSCWTRTSRTCARRRCCWCTRSFSSFPTPSSRRFRGWRRSSRIPILVGVLREVDSIVFLLIVDFVFCVGAYHVGVQSAAVNVICELARKNPRNYLALAPIFFKLMTSSTNNWMLIKIIKLVWSLLQETSGDEIVLNVCFCFCLLFRLLFFLGLLSLLSLCPLRNLT